MPKCWNCKYPLDLPWEGDDGTKFVAVPVAEIDALRAENERLESCDDEWLREYQAGNHISCWCKIDRLRTERDAALARVKALEDGLRPFAEASERHRLIADAVAGAGKPCTMQPVKLEWLIRAAALLAGPDGEEGR